MKLASFEYAGEPVYGLVDGPGVRPASAAFRAGHASLRAVLAAGRLDAIGADVARQPAVAASQVRFLPTIPDPGRILCIGMNYLEHIREMGREPPAYPAMFIRFADSLVGHGQPLIRPKVSSQFDYEGELAVVIGTPARHVHRDHALQHVAGYTCLMDGSLRDYQRHTSQFTAGKNFRHSGALGPWLVTADEIPDPSRLTLQTRVSGELLQEGAISDLCIDIPATIAYLSTICELQPGDIISTGTPSGVGAARKPPRWLQPGDTVEVEISGIGVLSNPVIDEAERR